MVFAIVRCRLYGNFTEVHQNAQRKRIIFCNKLPIIEQSINSTSFFILLGWYSETGFPIGMDRTFIVSVLGADKIAIYLILSVLISWFMKSIMRFLNNSNFHAIISTLLLILLTNLQRCSSLVSRFNLLQ